MNTSIFYVPHCDDESIGMGGAIAAAVRRGDNVRLVLVNRPAASPRALEVFAGRRRCNLHNGETHCYPDLDLGARRYEEFLRAVGELGLGPDRVIHLWRVVDERDPRPARVGDYIANVDALTRMAGDEPTHHLISGRLDTYDDGLTHPDHVALLDIFASVRSRLSGDVFGYRVYIYNLPPADRAASEHITLDPADHGAKVRALAEYRRWDPPHFLAYGWHSVPQLIENAAADPREFRDRL